MNKHLCTLTLALATAGQLAVFGEGTLENDPAYLAIDKAIDLKTIKPEVNVNLPRFLLQDAASELNGGTNDPLAGTGINFADLVKDVQLIRVVVIEAKTNDRVALEKGVTTLRSELEAKWTPVVSVPEENDSVGIYAMGDPKGESMTGLAVLVHDSGDTVIVNIVGHVSIGKLIRIATRMHGLPKDLLQKLGGLGNPADAKSGSDKDDASAQKPPKAPGGEDKEPKKDN
jgi:hypothetical protein